MREDLLAAVEHEGALTPALHEQIALTLHTLANQAQAVLLTCSSLGPVVEAMAQASMAPAVAQLADRPLTSPDASLEAVLALIGYRYI